MNFLKQQPNGKIRILNALEEIQERNNAIYTMHKLECDGKTVNYSFIPRCAKCTYWEKEINRVDKLILRERRLLGQNR